MNNSNPKAQLPSPKALENLENLETLEMRASDVTLKVRRAPKFLPFVLSGIVAGIIFAFIVNALIPTENRTPTAILGYLVLYCAGAGLGVGVLTAVVLDGLSKARAKQVSATKLER